MTPFHTDPPRDHIRALSWDNKIAIAANADAHHDWAVKHLLPGLTPSEISAFYMVHRDARYVRSGMENLNGPALAYHLGLDVTGRMPGLVSCMSGELSPTRRTPLKQRPRKTIRHLATLHGYRYCRGADGLYMALVEARLPPRDLMQFNTGRRVFTDKLLTHADAAHLVNEQGANPNAVLDVIGMMLDELYELCDWMGVTREHARTVLMRVALDDASERLLGVREQWGAGVTKGVGRRRRQ